MAWTEEARRAAAEARKAHSQQKDHFSKAGKFNISADTSRDGRSSIAKQIMRIRKNVSGGYGFSDSHVNEVMSNAAASTRLRNLNKAVTAQSIAHTTTKRKKK